LFAQLEFSRIRACELEENSKELTRVKSKLINLINDNSTLYKENVKLKLMLKDAEYKNLKTNSENLLSTNYTLMDSYSFDSNSKLKKDNFN